MKGRANHHHRLQHLDQQSGAKIENEAISHAESGKAAEGLAMRRGGGRVRRRRGGAVSGKKTPRRIDKTARAATLKPGGPPSYQGPAKPEMPFSGAEAKDPDFTHETPDSSGIEEEEYRAKGGGVHIKPSHRGRLHRDLGVPEGEKIPMAKKEAAKHSKNPRIRKEANFAVNFGHKT